MANTVVVPDNSSVPANLNFVFDFINDTSINRLMRANFVYRLKPKHGVWYEPFVGCPVGEFVRSKIVLRTNLSGLDALQGGGFSLMRPNDDSSSTQFQAVFTNTVATANTEVYVTFNILPSEITLGDKRNINSIVYLRLRK